MKNLRWRVLTTLVVVGLALWAIYPPDQKIKLGLDLQGGVHLVLRVQTDDALRLDTETTMEQLREAAETKGVSGATFTATTPTQFKVEGVPQPQDAAFREAANEVQATFNRESGVNGSYTFEMKPNIAVQLREDAVDAGAADDRPPRERSRRRRAGHCEDGLEQRSDHRRAAGREGSGPREGDHPVDGAPRAQDGGGRPGEHEGSAAAVAQRRPAVQHGRGAGRE